MTILQLPSASVGGTSYEMTQGTNGKWYVYVVDRSQAALFDGDSTATGL